MAQTLTLKYFGLPNPVKDFLTTIGLAWTVPTLADGGYARAFINNDSGNTFQNWAENTGVTPDDATQATTIATDGLGTYSLFQFVIHNSQKEQFENVISNFVFYLDGEKLTLSKDTYAQNGSWARYTIKSGLPDKYWDDNHTLIVGYSSGITVTPTLTNCTIYPTDTKFNSGSEVTFTVRANDGYKFTTAPTIGSTAMTKVTNTVYTATVTLSTDTTITASARKPSRLYATNKMVSGDYSPKNSWYTNGQKVNFTASGSDYTQFTIPPTINGVPMEYYGSYATYNNWVMTDDVVFEGKADYGEITYYTATINKSNCSIYPQATQFYDGQEITVTVWADDGFSFYDVPTVDGTAMTKLSNTAYTYTFTPTKDFEIVANASKPKVYHNATYNLTNCTISPNDAQLVEGQEYTFTVTANEHYEFTTAPTLNDTAFTKVSDSVYQITTAITSDITVNANATAIPMYNIFYDVTQCYGEPTGQFYKGTQVTVTLTANSGYGFTNEVPTVNSTAMTKVAENQYTYTGTITENWTVVGIAYYIPKTFTVTANLTNCTISPTTTQFREGSSETFIISANDGYTFKTAPTSTLGDVVKVNDTQYSIGITFTDNVTITASAEELPKAVFTFGTLTNCTCNYKSGDNLDATKAIVFTANDGYYFDNYTVTWVSSTGLVLHSTLNGSTATLLDANTVKSYVDSRESISIGDVQAIISLVDVVSGVNVYTITNDELTDLMNVRFVADQTDSANDFGKYIANLYIAPFNIEDIKGSETTIVLGYRNSNVGATRLVQTYIDISLGSITIPNYENAYETNANYRLYLPFIREIVNLPTEFVVGHTITINYHIDFIEESITVTITNESLEMPFTYNKYSFGRNLPFFNTEYGSTNLQYDNEQVNNTMTAYVIKTVNEAYNDNTEIGKNTYIYDAISNYEGGYIECTNAKVEDGKITKQESDELSTLLRNGVYVNAIS